MAKDSAASGERFVLGYNSDPLPHVMRSARIHGLLSRDQYDLLGLLYGSADFAALAARKETPRLTLERIAEGIRWEHTVDALSKLIRRTREDGWFDYRTELAKGKRGGVVTYVFTLRPEGPEPVRGLSEVSQAAVSEVSQNAKALPARDSAECESEPVRGLENGEAAPLSEQALTLSEVSESGRPLPEPDSASSVAEPVRAAQRNQREQEPLMTDDQALGEGTRSSEQSETDNETFLALMKETGSKPGDKACAAVEEAQRACKRRNGTAPVRVEVAEDGSLEWWPSVPEEGEEAVLADCQALVAAGLAQWDEEIMRA